MEKRHHIIPESSKISGIIRGRSALNHVAKGRSEQKKYADAVVLTSAEHPSPPIL